MTFPSLVNTANTNLATNTTIPVAMPGSIVAGRLLMTQVAANAAISTATGWTLIGSQAGGGFVLSTYAKIAAGSDTLSLTFASSASIGAITDQYDGWSGSLSDIKYASTATNVIDPPPLTMGSNSDNLWLACCMNGSALTVPTNYGNLATPPTLGGFILERATRALTALTEDPGAFGGTGASSPVAWTVGIAPVGGGAPPAAPGNFLPFIV